MFIFYLSMKGRPLMSSIIERRQELVSRIGKAAFSQPLLSSGFWFHNDIRDNFYYASYLFAAAADSGIEFQGDRDSGKSIAEAVISKVLRLLDTNLESDTWGHFPLGLYPTPEEARPHVLPVELMGSLMVYFYNRYKQELSIGLRAEFKLALKTIYLGGYFRKPLYHYNHHEAKYTAAKLIFGELFSDPELLEDGRRSLHLTLERVQTKGMPEYGCLPWFWHWIQAFTCAWELTADPVIRTELGRILDYLWEERSYFYLKGAWVGTHSRGWPHDLPKDANVLFDYVQFGDFTLPVPMPRTEYAGFLSYEAPEAARQVALAKQEPYEITKAISKLTETGEETLLHSYTYVTKHYAAGGCWERYREFDNEQHRWDIALPLQQDGSVNRAFFFHPGEGYSEGDPRHQSEWMEVLYHQNTVMALFPIPAGGPDHIIGILPKGQWRREPLSLFGLTNSKVYFAVYFMQPYELREEDDRYVVTSKGIPNGIVMESVDTEEAESNGITNLENFAAAMNKRKPDFEQATVIEGRYVTFRKDALTLSIDSERRRNAKINGIEIDFSAYRTMRYTNEPK
jgi:hypothetical protein